MGRRGRLRRLGAGPLVGPLAGVPSPSPDGWGVFFLSLELLILFKAFRQGKKGLIYFLVPLFVLWANVHSSFLIGLLLLAAAVLGRLFAKQSVTEAKGAGFVQSLVVLAASALGCLINPSLHHAFVVAANPFLDMFRPVSEPPTVDQLYSFFRGLRIRWIVWANPDGDLGKTLGASRVVDLYLLNIFMSYYLIAVGLGLVSFVVNRARFSASRFLVFLTAALLWGCMFSYFRGIFGVVLAVVLVLNFQEAYQAFFGLEGRVDWKFRAYSTGGRLVTLLLAFALVARVLTGYGRQSDEGMFGYGFDPDRFAFEAAKSLAVNHAKIQGRVLNLTLGQGDAMVWKGYPEEKVFIDHREDEVYPRSLKKELYQIRRYLRDDAIEGWKPILDKYNISAVMVNMRVGELEQPSTAIYERLVESRYWTPFYDDGNVVMFGRSDLGNADSAYFKSNEIDPDALAYSRPLSIGAFSRPPNDVRLEDRIFQSRFRKPLQPHVLAAYRALSYPNARTSPDYIPDPAQCMVAIRHARTALSSKPDDTSAYRVLVIAYRFLLLQEWALANQIPLRPDRMDEIRSLTPNPTVMPLRHRQWLTALNFAVRTTPPQETPEGESALAELNLELFQRYFELQYLDLARDRLKAVTETKAFASKTKQQRDGLNQTLLELNSALSQVESQMVERANSQLDRAQVALAGHAPGMAIEELEVADAAGAAPNFVRPKLGELYNEVGWANRAFDLLVESPIDQSSFGGDAGVAARRRGETYFLLGDYTTAAELWAGRAIPAHQIDGAQEILESAKFVLIGDLLTFTKASIDVPKKLTQQALWEYDLALCELEAGKTESAAKHFTRCLELLPKINVRPVIVYYLEKLGKPVPPLPEAEKAAKK